MSEFIKSAGHYTPRFVSKILSKSITVFNVQYDNHGKKIIDEGELESDEEEPSFFSGIFNIDLLDSDYLNQ